MPTHGHRGIRKHHPSDFVPVAPSGVTSPKTVGSPIVVVGAGGSPPAVVLTTGPKLTGYVPHGVWASGLGSTAGTGSIVSYTFDWGDATGTSSSTKSIGGTNVPVPFAVHHYATAGTYTLSLTVLDSGAGTAVSTATVVVTALPAATVTIATTDNITSKLNGAAANAVIQVNAGTHTATGVWTPKAGQIVYGVGGGALGAGGPTITGANTVTRFMITNAGTNGGIVQGLNITAFRSDFANGFADGVVAPISGADWVIKDCRIYDNGVTGQGGSNVNVYNSTRLTIDRCRIDHADVTGITGAGGVPSDTTIMSCELDNNYEDTAFSITAGHYPWLDDGGPVKLLQSRTSVFIDNYSHDNNGMGVWYDTNNHNGLIALNRVEDNRYGGIFLEDCQGTGDNLMGTGYGMLVYFNTILRNGNTNRTDFNATPHASANAQPAAVSIWTSPNVDVQWNWMDGGLDSNSLGMCHGVIIDYSPRGSSVTHCRIQNNDIRVGGGTDQSGEVKRAVGFTKAYGGAGTIPSGITVNSNHYYFNNPTTDMHFSTATSTAPAGGATLATYTTWQAAGYDASSTQAGYSSWPH